jgi:hypothetical protein
VSVMKMVAQWRTASPTNYGTVFGVSVPVNPPDRQTQDRRRRGLRGDFGTATNQGESAEANLASGKHVENSVPYGTHLDVICWVLEDTGLDG